VHLHFSKMLEFDERNEEPPSYWYIFDVLSIEKIRWIKFLVMTQHRLNISLCVYNIYRCNFVQPAKIKFGKKLCVEIDIQKLQSSWKVY
jgi:hypothetical protein